MHGKIPRLDSEDEKKRTQQEAQRQIEANRREERERRRELCTFLTFWQFCADPRCKRARACAGDVERCFNRFWPHVPEDTKNVIRHATQLVRDGMPPAQAAIEAKAYVAQRKRIGEATKVREAARRAAPPPPEPAPIRSARSAPSRPRGPRVTGL